MGEEQSALSRQIAAINVEEARVADAQVWPVDGFERELEVELTFDGMDRQPIEMCIPFREARVKNPSVGDLHRLPMIG